MPLTGLESHGGATTVQDEREPGLDFYFVFCVRKSSAREFVYFVVKLFKCSPVPACFVPLYELCYNYIICCIHAIS